jgi:hypothetical protein
MHWYPLLSTFQLVILSMGGSEDVEHLIRGFVQMLLPTC